MNTPLAFHEEKNVNKSAQKKKYTHIFNPPLDPNPLTYKIISFCKLTPQLTQPRSCTFICTIIVGVIQRNFLPQISNLWHKKAQVVMLKLLTCICRTIQRLQDFGCSLVPEMKFDKVMPISKTIYQVNRKFGGLTFNFQPCEKKF